MNAANNMPGRARKGRCREIERLELERDLAAIVETGNQIEASVQSICKSLDKQDADREIIRSNIRFAIDAIGGAQ